jgi:hypothetical protein
MASFPIRLPFRSAMEVTATAIARLALTQDTTKIFLDSIPAAWSELPLPHQFSLTGRREK